MRHYPEYKHLSRFELESKCRSAEMELDNANRELNRDERHRIWSLARIAELKKLSLSGNDLIYCNGAFPYNYMLEVNEAVEVAKKEFGYRFNGFLLLPDGVTPHTMDVGQAFQLAKNVLGLEVALLPRTTNKD